MLKTDDALAENGSSYVLSRPGNKRLLALCEILLWTAALLIPACGGFYRYVYYQHFQQGSCTITDGEVTSEYVSSKSGDYTDYYAHFSYIVTVPGTNGIDAQGYDGPDHTTFYSEDEAQSVVNQYPVGTVASCWYNPDKPTDAVLVFGGYPLDRSWAAFWVAIMVVGLLDLLPIIIWYNRVRFILVLRERGRMTKGVVERHEQIHTKNGTSTISIIGYKAISVDNQRVEGTLRGPGYLRINSRVSVCYDPYRPKKALRGERPTRVSLVGWIFLALLLLAVISIGASLLTYLVA